MEVKLILENNWLWGDKSPGMGCSLPTTLLQQGHDQHQQEGTSMNQDWSVVKVGDEVRIMYYEDPPIDERYKGTYTVTEITAAVPPRRWVPGRFGTMAENKKYQSAWGARLMIGMHFTSQDGDPVGDCDWIRLWDWASPGKTSTRPRLV